MQAAEISYLPQRSGSLPVNLILLTGYVLPKFRESCSMVFDPLAITLRLTLRPNRAQIRDWCSMVFDGV